MEVSRESESSRCYHSITLSLGPAPSSPGPDRDRTQCDSATVNSQALVQVWDRTGGAGPAQPRRVRWRARSLIRGAVPPAVSRRGARPAL
eukprot:274220-Hanusia_phi.AAC.1